MPIEVSRQSWAPIRNEAAFKVVHCRCHLIRHFILIIARTWRCHREGRERERDNPTPVPPAQEGSEKIRARRAINCQHQVASAAMAKKQVLPDASEGDSPEKRPSAVHPLTSCISFASATHLKCKQASIEPIRLDDGCCCHTEAPIKQAAYIKPG